MPVINIDFEIIEEKERRVMIGDCFLVEDRLIQLVEISGRYGLFDLGEAKILSTEIQCITHAINHVRKHYGDFSEIIPKERISLVVKRDGK